MTTRTLLDLAVEYVDARDAARDASQFLPADIGNPAGRDPDVIAADFDHALSERVDELVARRIAG